MSVVERTGAVPLLHHYPAFRRDPVTFWQATGEQGPVVRVRFGPFQEFWVLTEPGFVEHVLLKAVKDHPRDRKLMKVNRAGGPELMFNTDRWEEWRWRRRLMTPAFHRTQVVGFGERMVAQAERLVDELAAHRGPVEIDPHIRTLTMRIILETMFGVEREEDMETLHGAFEASSSAVFRRASAPLALPRWVPTPANRSLHQSGVVRYRILSRIVAERHRRGPGTDDLLDLLIAAGLEEERPFTPEELVFEMSGIVFAGHDTTAATLTWLLYLLTLHPDAERRLRAETDRVVGDRAIRADDLGEMPYTDWAIQEAMRLYPAVYVTLREADSDGVYERYQYPKGTRFLINIRGLHRDPAAWDAPNEFRPERFDPAAGTNRHRFQYIPFLGGPKKCLGDGFAMTELRLVVPTLLRHLRFSYAGDRPVRERASFTMGPDNGVPMLVERR